MFNGMRIINESPKMVIDGDKYDFVEDPAAAKKVLAMIDEN